MAQQRAPKQWPLSKHETLTSFENWRQNPQYTLSLDANFAPFLLDQSEWKKKTNSTPLRGLVDGDVSVPVENRRTAMQKVTHLDLMLGQIANFCPIISRNTIVKNSVSIKSIWHNTRQPPPYRDPVFLCSTADRSRIAFLHWRFQSIGTCHPAEL